MRKSKLISSVIMLFLCVACSQEKVNKEIASKEETALKKEVKPVSEKDISIFCQKQFGFSDSLSAIFVLTDRDCISCNRSFSEFIQHYLQRKDVGFVIESAGAMVDIAPYLEQQKRPNLVFDQEHLLEKYKLPSKSGAYLLKNNKLDTLVFIHAATLVEEFKYLKKQLEISFF
ncbi:MAG: hypothetical protein ABI207_08995 [Crocinitomicaceae bacterium]